MCQWLAEKAMELGVDIFPGFSANKYILNDQGHVCGIATADMGVDKQGNKKNTWAQGMDILAKQTIFAEGARGHLGKKLIKEFNLDEGKPKVVSTFSCSQSYPPEIDCQYLLITK